jgi:hypothetical protein
MREVQRGDAPTGEAPDDTGRHRDREAEEAHGGSMAPGLVDDRGHPINEPPTAGEGT